MRRTTVVVVVVVVVYIYNNKIKQCSKVKVPLYW
jgi:hypothetical protein